MNEFCLFPREGVLFSWFGTEVVGPLFSVEGRTFGNGLTPAGEPFRRTLPHGAEETVFPLDEPDFPGITLGLVIRNMPGSAILRFMYRFGGGEYRFDGGNAVYARVALGKNESLTEVQLAQFDAMVHSYTPNLREVPMGERVWGTSFIGPIALMHGEKDRMLAYEHGADAPDRYLEFTADTASVTVRAVKGNVFAGQAVEGYETCWFQLGAEKKDEPLFVSYRRFLLEEICENAESRRPLVFYNTWNFQERANNYGGKPYLWAMNEEKVAKEIDVAHELGVDVFVIDTGWFEKTGDWQVSRERFPHGLDPIRKKLEGYGMRLGLWFNPIVAARSSHAVAEHPEWAMSKGGETHFGPIWETEESCGMCLASDYADYHIEQLVKICREWGVRYIKWDGIGQYGCDSPLHHHGTEANTPEEREAAYSYQMGLAMVRIVREVTRRVPGVIFDFDITEGGRFVGLSFLSAGKYFLVNNGPYAMDFDFPENATAQSNKLAVGIWGWSNLFFFPGAARPRFCRSGALFDEIVPSVLFLTHYLPDGSRVSLENSLASMVLGGNGIWGDLENLTAEERVFWKEGIARYKRVADSVTRAYPRNVGHRGISPEIHEKLDENGRGVVCFFTSKAGEYTHITRALPRNDLAVTGADAFERLPDGALKLTVRLEKDGARTVFVE